MKYLNCMVVLFILSHCHGCAYAQKQDVKIHIGAEQLNEYIPLLVDKKVALLINHTSKINDVFLLDTLISRGIDVVKIFAPEHGFRGNKANGEKINNEVDEKTGLPILSLYGKNKKPSIDMMTGIDAIVYDIQDVGARFYTYISTMHYMMEACAENNIEMIILDRPNPNGHYVDGPVLEMEFQSFVGMHPIPIVYGMTAGELAQMILGEGWLENSNELNLTIIKNKNYTHQSNYILPIAPSPNLPNSQSIALYPSLCLFEGTQVSVGRGTPFPFQVVGVPDSAAGTFTFTPVSIPEASKYPKHENQLCFGQDLRTVEPLGQLDLTYLLFFYQASNDKANFFNSFFSKLAGTEKLRSQIESGLTSEEIRASWQNDLDAFKKKRVKYLLYD